MTIKKISKLSMLLSISVVLSLIESFIPIFNGIIPGIKLGLANIVILYALYKYSFKFDKNPRMKMQIALLNKMPKEKLETHLKIANNFLEKLFITD